MLFSRFIDARMRAKKRATKCYAVKSNRRRVRARIYIERIVTRLYTVAGNEIKKKICKRGGGRHRREKEGTEKRRWRCGKRRKRRDDIDKGACRVTTLQRKEGWRKRIGRGGGD